MNCIVTKITDWLTKEGVISESEYELYQYAIICLFSICTPLFFSIIIGFILGCIVESILLILPFIFIRKFAGGYHAKNSKVCLVASFLIIGIFISLGCEIKSITIVNFIVGIATLGLIILSPVDSVNRRLIREEKWMCKKLTVFMLVVFWIIAELLSVCNYEEYAKYILLGIILTFVLQIPVVGQKIYCKLYALYVKNKYADQK